MTVVILLAVVDLTDVVVNFVVGCLVVVVVLFEVVVSSVVCVVNEGTLVT